MNSKPNVPTKWGTQVEIERRNRIRLAIAAYAYEMGEDSIMSDSDYDALAATIRPDFPTGHDVLDKFFLEEYVDYSGQWIYNHPELDKVAQTYERWYKKCSD